MKAGELRDIIEKIEKAQKLNLVEISAKADVNRSYLSNLLNEDEEKAITTKLYRKFQNAFPVYFPKSNKTNKKLPPAQANGKPTPQNDLQAIVRDLTEAGIRYQAAITVLSITVAELVSKQPGKSIGSVSSELQRAISLETHRLLDERKRTG